MKKKTYIARDRSGELYIYTKGKPDKGAWFWGTDNPDCVAKIGNNILPEIKWEDEEPTEVTIEIVGKEEQQSQKQPKQQTKFDPKTLKPFDKVLAKDYDICKWVVDFYSHNEAGSGFPYICIGNSSYKYCIPYNDDTKHLVGTTEEAPEYYKYWKD